ncbi:MAG TPA: TonB-dependent receptor [Gemmatimonadetes bacterium]|nr:TonB-dependent receptor [Gemmatimonadota bacterium]
MKSPVALHAYASTNLSIASIVRTGLAALMLVVLSAFTPHQAAAQGSGTIVGQVVAADNGAPLASVTIFIDGSNRRAATNSQGRFTLAIPAGDHVLVAERLGLESTRQEITVSAGATTTVNLQVASSAIELSRIVVTAAREAQDRSRVAASVGVVDRSDIANTLPSHPSEIMGRVAGVLVNTTGGEGHMTAIRQPLSTAPVYLYLEDGLPTRSTGFFNHNALYEINLPQADRIEVMKGPASALYGSDAIGGVINVGTRRPADEAMASLSLEGGGFGYKRALGTVSGSGLSADLNITETDGWRTGTDYKRQSATLRWDRTFGDGVYLKTVAALSNIDQATAGTSALSRTDYLNDPTANYTPISFREVRAFRVSTALEAQAGAGTLSLTPFFRFNSMDLLPNWSLTFDPAIWETQNTSYGLQAKYGVSLKDTGVRIVSGVDFDYSPGSHFETSINPVRTAGIFDTYTDAADIYDYDVTFAQASPYVQADYETGQFTISAGVRSDFIKYDYNTRLAELQTGPHRRPADASPSFQDVTPKFGITYNPAQEFGVFGSYRHGFRAPSEGQIFRQGLALNTLDLKPVQVESTELGVRGVLSNVFRYELTGYYMSKTDDILGFRLPDGSSETLNAGETLHKGLEAQIGASLAEGLSLDIGYTFAEHTYEDWRPNSTTDLAGNRMEFAPRQIGNAVLEYEVPALAGSSFSFEWNRLGPYFEDASNDNRYEGHDLFNARTLIPVGNNMQVFARLQNVTNTRYAERASFNAFRGEELAPGLPRTLYAGIRVTGGLGL